MRHPAREERIGLCRILVHVSVERVAGKLGEVFDVFQRDGTRTCRNGFADLQFAEPPGERMRRRLDLFCARQPLSGNAGQNVGRTLNGRALHVVEHATNPAQLLAAAGAARPAMHHVRHRRAMPGRFSHGLRIVDVETAMPGSTLKCHFTGSFRIGGEQRGNQAAATPVHDRAAMS